MKKLFIVISIFIGGQLNAQSFATENINNYNNQNYFKSWVIAIINFTLKPDQTYTAEFESGGLYWYNSGTYEQRKDILQLFPKVCKESASSEVEIDCNKTLGNAKVELIFDDQSLYYTQFLKIISEDNADVIGDGSNSFLLPVTNKALPAGEIRMFNGLKVISMGNKAGMTTSEVKIRKTPDTNGEVLAYVPELFGETIKAVPINTDVTVIARTENKVKVQKWENYWYLVNVGYNFEVWMYGEFVKFN